MDLYVYYKVGERDAAGLLPRVFAMQAALAVDHGIAPRLQRRPESREGLQTWMEIYPGVAQGFQAALDDAAQAAGLAGLGAGARRNEVFVDLDPEPAPCA